jgi:hypothetical protein
MTLSVDSPYYLTEFETDYLGAGAGCNVSGTQGFRTHIFYRILSRIGNVVLPNVGINEAFYEFPPRTDYQTNNWTVAASGSPTPAGEFYDNICYTTSIWNPQPLIPQVPLSSSRVYTEYQQQWRAGSENPGSGQLVQKNALSTFLDHGSHENVVSLVF